MFGNEEQRCLQPSTKLSFSVVMKGHWQVLSSSYQQAVNYVTDDLQIQLPFLLLQID